MLERMLLSDARWASRLTGRWGPAAPRAQSGAEAPVAALETALERVAREHARLVYRVAYAVLRNHHDAEDATQEVFLRVLKLRRELEGVRNLKSWIGRIAFRVALDRRPRRLEVSIDDQAVAAAVGALQSAGAGADAIAASREIQALVAREIAALPEDLRHAVQLSTLQELTSAEIAALLEIPEGTVRTRLMRARRFLRDALSTALGRHE